LADKVSAESKSVVLKPDYETLKSYVLEALNK